MAQTTGGRTGNGGEFWLVFERERDRIAKQRDRADLQRQRQTTSPGPLPRKELTA